MSNAVFGCMMSMEDYRAMHEWLVYWDTLEMSCWFIAGIYFLAAAYLRWS